MPLRRLSLAVSACLASSSFAVIGGACLPSSPPVPSLNTGSYVLTSGGSQVPPQITFIDGTGRSVRVIADTLRITTSTHSYVEHGSIAITSGGTEQPPTPIALGPQNYTVTGITTFELPVTIAGAATGTIVANTTIDLRITAAMHWTFQLR